MTSKLIIGLVLLMGFCGYSIAETTKLLAPNKPVPLSYFGIHNHRFHDPAMRPSIDFGTWRLWDAGVEWSLLQPKKNEWQFGRLDFALEVANSKRYELLLTFGRTPAWASAQPNAPSLYGLGEAAPPRDMADFANFVRRVASRYVGKIWLYEVWNEPASSGMFSGTVAQMVEMTKIVRDEVARIDPDARIVCPSPAKFESLDWFRHFVKAGGANYCDIIGYHFYTDSVLPEDKLKLIKEVFGVLKQHDLSMKPVWDTESGVGIGGAKDADFPVASAPAHVARWLILEWVSGVERFYWYSWDHDRFGFKHPNGVTRDRALKAYTRVQQWMLGSTFQSCDLSDLLWNCKLHLSDGKAANIMWTQDNRKRAIEIKSGSRAEDIYGNRKEPNMSRLMIEGDPVLIIDAEDSED